MASLEPPFPPVGDNRLGQEEQGLENRGANGFLGRLGKWRRAVGLLLLGCTVFLWTTSNFLASTIFADQTYSKPYFVTYFNTAFFILPLIPILLRKAYKRPEEFTRWRHDIRSIFTRSQPPQLRLPEDDEDMSTSQTLLLGSEPSESFSIDSIDRAKSAQVTSKPSPQLSLHETSRLALEFCLLWFAANYFVSACLSYTTVASSTILTSTSSVFTLLFGALFRVEIFTSRKCLAVFASLAGIALISSIDFSGENNDADHRGDFPKKAPWEIALGDGLALLSAVLYGLYAVFMKSRIRDESRVNMPLFFGLVGLFNVLLLWPGFFVLHFTGVEIFEMPPTRRVLGIIMANSVASLVSDVAWAYAVLLTSPIVVTVGLSLTIPLSLVGQVVLNGQTTGALYWVGAVIVVLSFVFVQEEERKDEVMEGSHRLGDEEVGVAG
nr:hypothetical protein B0A51_12027 [Rachicladosporium sp. CCFEE 5018]